MSKEESVIANVLYDAPKLENLRDLFLTSLKEHNNARAFILKEKIQREEKYFDIHLQEFIDDYEALGAALVNKGFKDKRLGVCAENRYEWAVGYVSTICGLGLIVPIDKSLPYEEMKKILERAELSVMITSYKYVDTMFKLKEEGLDIPMIVLMDLYTTSKEQESIDKLMEKYGDKILSMSHLIAEGKKMNSDKNEFRTLPIDNEKMAALLFTSATTSVSKAVMLSHKNIITNVVDLRQMFDLGPKDRILSFLPMHHCFECVVGFLVQLSFGTTICFAESLKSLSKNIKEYRITIMTGVPILFEAIYNKVIKEIKKKNKYKKFKLALKVSNTLRMLGIDKSREIFKDIHQNLGGSLRLLMSGAAPLNPEIEKGLFDLGFDMHQGYGLTETSPVIATTFDKYRCLGSVGKVLPSIEIKIDKIDDSNSGEILVKGSNVMLGYYNDEENNKMVFTEDGWLKTGDIGYIRDGYLFISGRTKNVIVLKNGKNIFPDESEILINNIEGVKESMVFGLPNENDEQDIQLAAKIVYDEEYFGDKTEKEIEADIWKQVKDINKLQPTYKYIKKIFITKEDLIKTTTLKIKRYEEMKKIKKEYLTK